MEFLPFRPGLVGGHCIGVDPYYLCCKAEELDTLLKLFFRRRVNDNMGKIAATRLIKGMLQRHSTPQRNVLILGFTKENCLI